MSTRGLVGFVVNGDVKVAYNHCDSYPSGLGTDVLNFCKEMTIDVAKMAAEALTPAEEEEYEEGNLSEMLKSGSFIDAYDFGTNSLFCEWGYVVNFDTNMLEVYRGWNDTGLTEGLWEGKVGGRGGYGCISRIVSFPLNELPDSETFEKEVNKNDFHRNLNED